MTIEEAIENLKCDTEIDMYIHDIAPQIAEWLEELKEARKGFEENRKAGYNRAIQDFYDKVLNFEDYIEPKEYSDVLLYSGKDITNMIVRIKNELNS